MIMTATKAFSTHSVHKKESWKPALTSNFPNTIRNLSVCLDPPLSFQQQIFCPCFVVIRPSDEIAPCGMKSLIALNWTEM